MVKREVDTPGGRSGHVILGGFSQGSAVALWSLCTGMARLKRYLGAFVGLSAWMSLTKEAQGFAAGGKGGHQCLFAMVLSRTGSKRSWKPD
jgi:lysophospholipase-2